MSSHCPSTVVEGVLATLSDTFFLKFASPAAKISFARSRRIAKVSAGSEQCGMPEVGASEEAGAKAEKRNCRQAGIEGSGSKGGYNCQGDRR